MQADIVFVRDGRWVIAQSLVLDIASQGRTVDAAVRNLHEAMALYADQSHLQEKISSAAMPAHAGIHEFAAENQQRVDGRSSPTMTTKKKKRLRAKLPI